MQGALRDSCCTSTAAKDRRNDGAMPGIGLPDTVAHSAKTAPMTSTARQAVLSSSTCSIHSSTYIEPKFVFARAFVLAFCAAFDHEDPVTPIMLLTMRIALSWLQEKTL